MWVLMGTGGHVLMTAGDGHDIDVNPDFKKWIKQFLPLFSIFFMISRVKTVNSFF